LLSWSLSKVTAIHDFPERILATRKHLVGVLSHIGQENKQWHASGDYYSPVVSMDMLIKPGFVIPAKAGIQENLQAGHRPTPV
jgi:hypothetical protein